MWDTETALKQADWKQGNWEIFESSACMFEDPGKLLPPEQSPPRQWDDTYF